MPVNNNPANPNKMSFATIACIIIAQPVIKRKDLIKFQLLNNVCFIKANVNLTTRLFGNKGYKAKSSIEAALLPVIFRKETLKLAYKFIYFRQALFPPNFFSFFIDDKSWKFIYF